jgi:hypothetical protein
MTATRKKRNKAQRNNHRQRIADLRLQGHTIAQIVKATRLSESTVHRELRALADEWRESAADSINEHRVRELARLEIIERDAWAEWDRSRKNYAKEVTERLKGAGEKGDFETGPKVVRRETGGRIGEAKFLQIILNAQDARRKLLGLDAPTKMAPTDPNGEKAYEPAKMSDAELDARLMELAGRLGLKAAVTR